MAEVLKGAVKSALFKSPVARGAAMVAMQGAVATRIAQVTTPASEKIAWDVYNWPHPRIGMLHFDLVELQTKKPAFYPLVSQMFFWWLTVIGMLVLNLVDAIVLSSVVKGSAFGGLTPFFSFLTLLSLGSTSFVAVRAWYHGVCENSGRSKTVARAILAVLDFLWLIFFVMPSGNILGLVGFAQTARHEHALADGTSGGAVAYWQAATVIESLGFLGLLGWTSFLIYRVFTFSA